MADFPSLAPTSRSFTPGNWPVKAFRAMNGAEVRILYGDTRSGQELKLTYENIPDATAEQFFEHYYEHHGTFETFALPASTTVAKGWKGSSTFFNAGSRVQYRWAEPPSVNGVRPGRSTVSISLIGVQV